MPRSSIKTHVASQRISRSASTKGAAQPSAPRAPAQPRTAREATPALARGVLPALVGYHLRLTQMAVFKDFSKALEASPGQFGLLTLIDANPGLSQSRLAEAIGLDRSSLVPALNKLSEQDLVQRRDCADDRRANGIWLTARGQALLADMRTKVRQHEARALAGFDATEKRQLIQLLQRMRKNLRAA